MDTGSFRNRWREGYRYGSGVTSAGKSKSKIDRMNTKREVIALALIL